MPVAYFVIVGRNDNLILDLDLVAMKRPQEGRDDKRPLHQFILYSALDPLEMEMWRTPYLYLKQVDSFNDMLCSAFLTGSGMKFLLLHDFRSEENVRQFFVETYEAFVRFMLSPFYVFNTPIKNRKFEGKVFENAQRYLRI
eukprot:Clim_evm12s26 gene=Clim_evmTU12s26